MYGTQNIQKYLLTKEREVADKLKLLEQEELYLSNSTPESQELGTYAWEAETTSTKAAIKHQLVIFSEQIHSTLSKMKKGTYGFCEKCPGRIEDARLEIMPTATSCISCVV